MIEVADDIVSLSDDDGAAEIIQTHHPAYTRPNAGHRPRRHTHKNKVRPKTTDTIETIDLDQLSSPQKSRQSNNNIIDLCNENNKQLYVPSCLQGLYKENALLAEFIEKCLDLENSDGMTRIINNTLMRIYSEMEDDYKYSRPFHRILLKATLGIECDPDHKYSHLKSLCETMKEHRAKKRAKLVTLATGLKKKGVIRRSSKFYATPEKRQKVHLIDSDDDQDIPVINLEDDHNQNELIVLDETQNNEEKENQQNHNNESNKLLEPLLEVYWEPTIVHDIEPTIAHDLEPATSPSQPQDQSEDDQVKLKINDLENKIAECKRLIKMYDEAEVDLDSSTSPYILSEKLKKNVVSLYKELCDLTGRSPVKRRKVRLEVLEGHPTGPVKKLEKFLNVIGKDGNLPFPDFYDVINCVIEANVESGLGWTKQEVLKEATALFIYCGRELQRQRQRREYKYLLSYMKQGNQDPADDDLELNARLEANRRIAKKKEDNILERYAMLQSISTRKPSLNPQSDLNGPIQTNLPDPDTHSDTEDDPDTNSDTDEIETDVCNGNILQNHLPLEVIIDIGTGPVITAVTETVVSVENQNVKNELGRDLIKPLEIDAMSTMDEPQNDNSTTIKANDNLQIDVPIEERGTETIKPMEIGAMTAIDETNDNGTKVEVNDNFQTGVPEEDMGTDNTGSIDKVFANDEGESPLEEKIEIDTNLEPVQPLHLKTETIIKKEPEENIVKKLEDLGEDFTVSVLDIEDPFVSIEISDSSDDDE